MSGLRAYKDRQGYYSVGGRCLAHAKIVSEDGKEEQLRFPSKYFQVVVRDTEEPVLPKIPEDCKFLKIVRCICLVIGKLASSLIQMGMTMNSLADFFTSRGVEVVVKMALKQYSLIDDLKVPIFNFSARRIRHCRCGWS